MKTLTIKQPWAELIASGDKLVENRPWRTHFRGRIAVHAGLDKTVCRQMNLEADYIDFMSFGAIIATVEIIDCVQLEDRKARQTYPWLAGDEYACGPWCWILKDAQRLPKPIPAKGALSFWETDAVKCA